MSSVDMVGEAGGLELAVPVGGAVLRVLLGGVARLGCSSGPQQHRVSGPVAISDIDGWMDGASARVRLMGLSMWTHPCTSCQQQARHVVVVGRHPSVTLQYVLSTYCLSVRPFHS